MSKQEKKSALNPIRVLDLTIGNIDLGPRMLGDGSITTDFIGSTSSSF